SVIAAQPRPILPCGSAPERYATPIGTSRPRSDFSSCASLAVFSSRLRVFDTAVETSATSLRRIPRSYMGCKYWNGTVGPKWNFLHDESPNPRNFKVFEQAVNLHFQGVMTTFRMFLRQIRDPRWIPHISSYCDSRCHRCAFRERCWSYAFRDDPDALPHDLDLDAQEGKPSERHIALDLDDIARAADDAKE